MSWIQDTTEFETLEEKQNRAKAEIKERFVQTAQKHLDTTAQEREYDGILSLCTYATSLNDKFRAEGQAAVEWRDQVWEFCYQELTDVEAGIKEVPSEDEFLSRLPSFTWPV